MYEAALPVPWRDGDAAVRIHRLICQLEKSVPVPGSARHDLLLALRHARVRAQEDPWHAPPYVRFAQAVLEIAVEWSMPSVEKWAVAWLAAGTRDRGQLRLRWSSRSRDGKIRRDGLAPSPVTALAAGSTEVFIGCRSGQLASWSDESGLTRIAKSLSAIWAIAAREGLVFAAGDRADFVTVPETWALPSLQEGVNQVNIAGIVSAAIGPSRHVACGDERGVIRVCAPGGHWISFPNPTRQSRVLTLSFYQDHVVRAVWKDGTVAESDPDTPGRWSSVRSVVTSGLVAAAFDHAGQRLALAEAGGAVSVAERPSQLPTKSWDHRGVQDVAWSADGSLLASSAEQTLLVGEPGTVPGQISGEGAGGGVAFLGDDHAVCAQGAEVVQWALGEAGSYLVDRRGEDVITAVTIDPVDRWRTMVGTKSGQLLSYDGDGFLSGPLTAPLGAPVHQLARVGDAWLIATHAGAYSWTPGSKPERLTRRLSWAVAAGDRDGAYASNTEVCTLSGAAALSFPATVRDIRFGPGDTLAAADASGFIQVRIGPNEPWTVDAPEGSRLIWAGARSIEVRRPDGRVQELPYSGEYRDLAELPGSSDVQRLDASRFLVVRPDGVGLATSYQVTAARSPVLGIPARAAIADTDGRRVVVAGGKRLAGYDLLEPAAPGERGVLPLRVALAGGTCSVTLPAQPPVRLPAWLLDRLRTAGADTIRGQSEILSAASQLGDLIWEAGLAVAVDRARGDDPDRPVRLEWDCDAGTDDLPWELVHPSAATLGWFADPPVTTVRTVVPAASPRPTPAVTLMTRHSMLVIRGEDEVLISSDKAYDQARRRTRRSNVELLGAGPHVIHTRAALDEALPDQADILQLWAHCGRDRVQFSKQAWFGTDELADRLGQCGARLVMLIGCRSGALGRALVRRGVAAVVAMRVEVYSQTILTLVEDLLAQVLDGQRIDLAFADALHRYVLTGQPGAAAVPMLYLATGSTGHLFSSAPAWMPPTQQEQS
jgi:CHAT domain